MATSAQSPATAEHDNSGVVLLLQVPRTNEKKELAVRRSLQHVAAAHGLVEKLKPAFGGMDLLFLFLAVMTAFKLGGARPATA